MAWRWREQMDKDLSASTGANASATSTSPSGDRVLLIEDDSRLAGMVREYLGKAGYRVIHAENGTRGLALNEREPVDVIILDLMLPDADGLDICRQIRARSQRPILMLTARGDPLDRVVGLEMGADDYLPKPFEPRELLARLRAILRRTRPGSQAGGTGDAPPADVLRFGRLEIDRDARAVRLDGTPCTLTSYQFALLLALAEHAGRVMSRDALMDLVKGETIEAFDRSIDVHVSRIRAVIEDDAKKPRRIITVRGIGYVFAKAQD
jgi:two-component system, OmpR family, phosphate regulon response regulator OmpR